MRVLFLLCCLFTLPAWASPIVLLDADPGASRQEQNSADAKTDYRKIFASIEHGIASGNISSFSQYMAPYLHVTLRGEESGYFSASQAYYLLENYFKTRKLVNFDFSQIGESEANPYATGSAGFNYKGNREYVQVYISLSLVGGRWQITRINIY